MSHKRFLYRNRDYTEIDIVQNDQSGPLGLNFLEAVSKIN